ncbi:MAG: LLM class flavin-dependent oxidoreductase [SAR324 cluster bacterium]|nr:LLM class flavin-dependent oxidoreductase [SAR324 cluster bacterium]MCZ6841199.1 LLM class flavin-dependent oxidoreductase [SAR324 cluster bacterium]
MKFGTFFFFQNAPGRDPQQIIHDELDQIVWSEEMGFDHIWLTEHHFIDYGLSVDPPVLAATAAARTSTIRIGIAACILPFHNPVRLAEQLALVDIISNGRLDVGIGRGNRPAEFAGYNIPQIENRGRYEEIKEILVKAWTEESFHYDGQFYQIPEVRVIPKPQQQPHPPFYIVCVGPESIQTTARQGLPMLNSVLFGTTEQLAVNRDLYVKEMEGAGFSSAEVQERLENWGVSRHVYVAPTDAQALEEAKDAELWYQESLRRFLIPDRIEDAHPDLQAGFRAMDERLSQVTWEALVDETLIFGSPDTVVRKIEEMHDLRVGEALCWMNFGGLAQDKVRRSMELFSREVMPHLR